MIPPLNSDCLAACVWKCRNGLYFPTKKASVPLKGQKLNIILKYSKTSAVPPRLTHSARSPVCHHTPSPLTAGYRQSYSPFGFQTALTSPFRIVLRYCPFTTGQLSGNAVSFLLTLALRFSCSTVTKYNTRIQICQAPFNIFPL